MSTPYEDLGEDVQHVLLYGQRRAGHRRVPQPVRQAAEYATGGEGWCCS